MNIKIDIKQLFQSLQSDQNINLIQIFRKTVVLINIAIIVITLIFIKSIHQNYALQIKSLKKQMEEIGQKADIIREIKDREKEIGMYIEKLPAGKDFPDIVDAVTAIAYNNNIELLTISPGDRRYSQQYYVLPLGLSIRGNYYNIWNFLRAIESSQELFTLERVRIQGSDYSSTSRYKTDSKGEGYYSVEIKLFATSIKND